MTEEDYSDNSDHDHEDHVCTRHKKNTTITKKINSLSKFDLMLEENKDKNKVKMESNMMSAEERLQIDR